MNAIRILTAIAVIEISACTVLYIGGDNNNISDSSKEGLMVEQ